MIEGHGDDLYRYGGQVLYNFSTNITVPSGHEGLYAWLAERLAVIDSYPEPSPFTLERAIAEQLGVRPANVVVTNGATDAMYRVARHYAGRSSAIMAPSFREYQDACGLNGHVISFFNDIDGINGNPDVIWICSPNNPTGKVTPREKLLETAARHSEALIVLDQAYADYTEMETLSPQDATGLSNVLLLSSLTKRYAVPGLRVGYAVASEPLADMLRHEGMPWSVNALAIEGALYLLRHHAEMRVDAADAHARAMELTEALRRLGIECSDTDCNFLLCRLPKGDAANLKEYLVANHAVLIRDASNFEGLDSRCFRVAAQSPDLNEILINGIAGWMESLT